jgi:hypothetical protein
MIIDGNVLKAEEGKWLTNGDTFGKTVSLGINDSADNWHEITDEEALQNAETE